MSSLAHQSVARETAMLHQVSHYSLPFLSMQGLLTTWVCDHVWCYYVSRQKSSHKVPYFSPDTWSGVRRRWFIHAINSCASTPGRGETRLLEEKENKNEHRGRPVLQNHSAHERNMIKSLFSSLKYQFVRLFDLFFVLYFFFFFRIRPLICLCVLHAAPKCLQMQSALSPFLAYWQNGSERKIKPVAFFSSPPPLTASEEPLSPAL